MLDRLKDLWRQPREQAIEHTLDLLRSKNPAPVFWLFGKTQSGKSTLIRYLTGAAEAEVGNGFQPCTRTSRKYQFPSSDVPLITFLDTRGLDEPGYTADEDIAAFDAEAHLVLVTVKLLDQATEHLIAELKKIRDARPSRPILLVLTCLHEAYPQQQHPTGAVDEVVPEALTRSLHAQSERFHGLVDHVVPVDITPPEEGFVEPNYGGQALRETLLQLLPAAYRQNLLSLDALTSDLKEHHRRQAMPYILAYSGLAATAGAIPIPWVDLLILPGIQSKMIAHLAQLYGQPLSGARFLEVATTLGLGLLARQAIREVAKFIPLFGTVAAGALAGASTYALGQAFCRYYEVIHQGQVPDTAELQRYYREQFAQAEQLWQRKAAPTPEPTK